MYIVVVIIIIICVLGQVNTLCFVWAFSYITFRSLIHAYMYINNACNFMFTHQQLSKD